MFVGLKDIAAARGRVALMTGVVALITLLLVMLTGLTAGLGHQNTSALEALSRTYPGFVFSTEKPSFTESHFDEVPHKTTPLLVTQMRAETAPAAVFFLPAGASSPVGAIPSDGVIASRALGLQPGQEVRLGDEDVTVNAVVDDLSYSHLPVVWAPLKDTSVGATVALSADAASPGAVSVGKAVAGLASYSTEHGSLLTMQGFLYAISDLVTVAFLSVWTIQRTRDLSILRALGAAGRYLLRDVLGQAAVLLAAGVVVGGLGGLLLGWVAVRAVPFELSAGTVLAPVAGIWVLGMAGAFLATRRVTRVNPLLALGG